MELSIYFDELFARSSGKFSQNDLRTFLREMRRTPSGPLIISKLLANKIQSKTDAVALQAFEFLEATLETEVEGSIEFRTEVGRYRFLNEIIRILSPKYLGTTTSEKVKERAIKFLKDAAGVKRKKWFPSEYSKIETVFKSLVDGGIIIQKEDDANDPDAEFRKNIFERGENAALLRKLLQSKDPNDLQAANRLIKNLVDEEGKRNERRSELHSLIDRIETSTSLLAEMLNQACISDFEIIDELVSTCNSLRNKMGAVRTETNEETTSLVQASENIEAVIELYEKRKRDTNAKLISADADTAPQSAPASASGRSATSGQSLVDELLMGIDLNLVQSSTSTLCGPIRDDNNLLNLDVELDGGPQTQSKLTRGKSLEDQNAAAKKPMFDELNKMSRELMDQSLGVGVGGFRIFTAPAANTEKTSLNQLQLLQNSGSSSTPTGNSISYQQLQTFTSASVSSDISAGFPSNSPFLDLDFLEKQPATSTSALTTPQNVNTNSGGGGADVSQKSINGTNAEHVKPRLNSSAEDDNLLGLDLDSDMSSSYSNNVTLPLATSPTIKSTVTATPSHSTSAAAFLLSSIAGNQFNVEEIELIDNVNPVHTEFDEHVSLTLTFGQYPDRLPNQVKAAVITVTNKCSSHALFNYVFQVLPPKGVQVKLLPPSCMELQQWKKTFLPPPILTQLAFFVVPPPKSISSADPHPQQQSLALKYILSYCLGDETIVHNESFLLPHY